MKNTKLNAALLVLLILAFSCDKIADKIAESKSVIKLYNHSTKNIMIVEDIKERGFNYYPDTTLPSTKLFLIQVTPNDYGEILSSVNWADVINNIPSCTISIYVFDSDTINTYNSAKHLQCNV
jgi:hypothetical protein